MRLTRYYQKIFGSTGGPLEFGKFGSLAGGTPEYGTTPAEMQSLANFDGGWFAAILGNNKPAIEDMNALFYIVFYQIAYLMQNGIPEWDAETEYSIGQMVQDATGYHYFSLANTNVGNALTDATKWQLGIKEKLTQLAASTTLTQFHQMVEFNATTGDMVATLTAASAALAGKKITITKTDATTNVVTFVNLASAAVQLEAQYDSITVYCNGTVWYQI